MILISLVDFKKSADLFDLVGLGQFLEKKLHRKVDIVPKKALRAEIKKRVLEEVVQVWIEITGSIWKIYTMPWTALSGLFLIYFS